MCLAVVFTHVDVTLPPVTDVFFLYV